jgi:hypothetical protein
MSTVRDVVNSFDNSQELGQAQREAVEALAALGDSKAEVFKMEIQESLLSAGNGTNMTVPVSSISKSLKDVRAYSSSESGNLGVAVKNTLNMFLKGSTQSIVDGIGNLISETLSTFLGTASANTGTIDEYYVATEGLSVVRVDMKAWYLNVTASSIQTKMQRIIAVVGVKSIVNLAKIDFSTFLNLYQQQLFESGMSSQNMKAALQEAKEIYKDFQGMTKEPIVIPQSFITIPPAARNLERKKLTQKISKIKSGKNYLVGLDCEPTIIPKQGGWAQIRYPEKTISVSPVVSTNTPWAKSVHIFALQDGPNPTLNRDELIYRNEEGDAETRTIVSFTPLD